MREKYAPASLRGIDPNSMESLCRLCKEDKWDLVLKRLEERPELALEPLYPVENQRKTSLLHQAIASRGKLEPRYRVIRHVLAQTPGAAAIENVFQSLPLHSLCQRNVKMKSSIKELLIFEILSVYPQALMEQGGGLRRTPLHAVCTDYLSPSVMKTMIRLAPAACFIKDKNGYLPAHIACDRRMSPEKLQMLLDVNPAALLVKTRNGDSLLDLAMRSASPTHPNQLLIRYVEQQLRLRVAQLSNGAIQNLVSLRPPSAIGYLEEAKSAERNGADVVIDADDVENFDPKIRTGVDAVNEDLNTAALLLHFSRLSKSR